MGVLVERGELCGWICGGFAGAFRAGHFLLQFILHQTT